MTYSSDFDSAHERDDMLKKGIKLLIMEYGQIPRKRKAIKTENISNKGVTLRGPSSKLTLSKYVYPKSDKVWVFHLIT